MAPIKVMASKRGLAMMESPTHTWSKTPALSACSAMFRSSLGWVSPNNTPRLERVNPNRTFCAMITS